MHVNMNSICYLFIIVCSFKFLNASKYSKDANKNWHEEERPFRIAKVNMVWEKAKKQHISGPKLADLYADLKLHDKEQVSLKKYKADDLDKDGLKEAAVNIQFRNIINRYQLQEHFKTDSRYMRSANDIPLETEHDKMEFTDKKLQKIWKKAVMGGFNAEELNKLKQEFWHQQVKLDEYNTLQREIGQIEDISDNSIERFKKTGMDPESLKEKHADMKNVHKKISDGYLKLESLSVKKDMEFEDPRVYQLWALAKKANMSEEELDSFKSELKHFEHRITKHEYMKEQVYYSKQALKDEGRDAEYPDKHLELEEKEKHYGLKVKKLHSDLQRIVKKAMDHVEL